MRLPYLALGIILLVVGVKASAEDADTDTATVEVGFVQLSYDTSCCPADVGCGAPVNPDCCVFGEMASCNPTCATPGATCCNGTCESYRCCCCGHPSCYMPGIHKRKANGKLKWCRVWTTGDLYPHYAYYPANHGYYYFRPYNYINVDEHKQLIVQLGGDRHHPYSLKMFDNIYQKHYETHQVRVEPDIEKLIPGKETLPNLEELLD